MNKKARVILAAVLAVVICAAGAFLLARNHQMKAAEEAENGYTASEEIETETTSIALETEAETEAEIQDDVQAETDAAEAEAVETEAAETEAVETETEAEIERSVVVTTSLDGAAEVTYGTEVTLYASLYGYDGVDYTINWQRSADQENWETVDGANGYTYTYTLDESNYMYFWRAVVTEN